jgi:hypothetical protein
MGGIVSGLFGDKGKPGQPGQVIDVSPEAFNALQPDVAAGIQSLLQSGGGPQFSGPFAAPVTGQEQSLLNNIFSQVQQPGQGAAAAMPLLQQILSGQFLSPDSNPFLQQSIAAAQRPLIQQFQENTLPQLQAQFTRAGQFIQPQGSSPFDMAAARASSGLADALGDVSTRLTADNFNQERARQLPAAGLAAGLDQQQLQSTIQGLQAAALPRLVEDLGIERGLQEFQRRIQVLLQALGLGAGAAQPNVVTTQPTPGTPASGGLLSALAPAVGAFAGSPAGSAAIASLFKRS